MSGYEQSLKLAAKHLGQPCAFLFRSRSATDAGTPEQRRAFASLQRQYLTVYTVVMLADWLQGTHMYTLYTSYAATNASVSVGTLFFTGFMAAGVLGTFTGPMVDRYGRKNACLVYAALEVGMGLVCIVVLSLSVNLV
jgi:MFS family permease